MTRGEIDGRIVRDKDIDGLSYRIEVEPDYASTPYDADCYTPKQIEAWKRDDWQYVGVTVTPYLDGLGMDLPGENSLWGLEWGSLPQTTEDDRVIGQSWIDLDYMIIGTPDHPEYAYPVPEMIAEARGNLAESLAPRMEQLRLLLARISA